MSSFEPLERVRYFVGQVLTAADLQAEVDYERARWRRHNRYVVGWGVIAGLDVSTDGAGSVTVQPGLALDCAGREVALADPVSLPLAGLAGKWFVVVRYDEQRVAPQPAPDGATEFSRVREAARVELSASHPGAGHRHLGPGTPGCGGEHAVCLAALGHDGDRWRLTSVRRAARRRRG